MKNKIYILILILLPVYLLSTTIYVDASADPNGNGTINFPYQTINEAIDDLVDGDTIDIAAGTYTENLDFEDYYFTMIGEDPTTTIIDGNNNPASVIDLSESSSGLTEINNLTICNGSDSGINIFNRNVNIVNCIISNNQNSVNPGGGIKCYDNTQLVDYCLNIIDCIFDSNVTSVWGGGLYSTGSITNIYNCKFHDNIADDPNNNNIVHEKGGAICYLAVDGVIENTLIYDNYATHQGGAVYLIGQEVILFNIDFKFCTIVYNNASDGIGSIGGVHSTPGSSFDVSSSIFWGNSGNCQVTPGHTINYSCIEGGYYTGTGIIEDDPEFVDAANDDYTLEYYSPCIDKGNPSSAYYDPDGSYADMGCYYHEQDVYTWTYGGSVRTYIWKSFPKFFFRDSNSNTGQDIEPEYAFETWTPIPEGLDVWYENEITEYISGETDPTWSWDPDNDVCSIEGYKLRRNNGANCLLFSRGLLCERETDLTVTSANAAWLGYFLKDSQNVLDAIPDTVIRDAVLVKTQDWSISRNSTSDPWSGTPRSCKINYADCVILKTVNSHTFEWETPSRDSEPEYRPVAEHFAFNDDIDYIPIYAEFDENDIPDEVAVYVDDVCRGAQVVEDTICQICTHILEEDLGQEIEFAFWYEGRNSEKRCNSYLVYDQETGEYISGSLITGMQGIHYEVSFKDNYENVVPPEYDLNCYPNPFNPELTISFNLEETQEVKLNIYNVRGQKVKTLVSELFRPDDYNVVWMGDDNFGNKVSSGVYYIRLQVGDDIVNRKVILMK
ncbi:MAG: T9SS type A sorting domain-containing protein [Candidatus Stygibacter australis]|nr:T9SS type A sorting domain-containing protein [Candidatus Stygibacter australis]MDP8321495.1 T9SS type A sorting domain-containing protein [Candidatus Stygibacter australis]